MPRTLWDTNTQLSVTKTVIYRCATTAAHNGVMDKPVACCVRGPEFDSSLISQFLCGRMEPCPIKFLNPAIPNG